MSKPEKNTMSPNNQVVHNRSINNDYSGTISPSLRPVQTGLQQPRKVRLTVSLPRDLVDRLRDAVYWSPNLTLAWLIAQSLRAALADLEKSRQGPFPKRIMGLRVGRPRLVGQTMNVFPHAKSIGIGD